MHTARSPLLAAFLLPMLLAACDGSNSSPAPPVAGTTPDPFSFTDQTGVATSTEITSATVAITGISAPSPVTVTGGSYSVGCTASFVTTAGTIDNDQTVCVRHTSAATAGTATDTTLTVGGVSDTFTSTTAAVMTSSLLPFVTGAGDLRLYDPQAPVALPDTNPRTVDTGLASPPPGSCTAELLVDDCFGKARAFYSGAVTGATVSSLQAARLAYINGGAVYRVNLTRSIDSSLVLPAQISSVDDACRIVESETTDFGEIDNSAVIVERPGPDGVCGEPDQFPADPALDDNIATVIRLNSPAANAGIDLPLVLTAGNPLHVQTNASGVITGYVSFEGSGADARLVRRGTNLSNPTTLRELAQTGGASIERADLTHLFVTATPDDDGLTLFRVEGNGSLSPALHFFGFVSGNLIQDGLHDTDYLYFSHDNQLLRILLDAASGSAQPADVLTELAPGLRIIGPWALDTGATPDRVVFEARDDSLTVASGVFSVEVDASEAVATTLANYPDSEGGSATLRRAVNGRAYINITHHGSPGEDALRINTDGTGELLFAGLPDGSGAYWAGSNRATGFDRVTDFAVPTRYIFLSRHGADLNDTLSVFDPLTGLEGIELGTVESPGDFQAVKILGLGRYALARVEIDRSGARDSDVYALDAETTGSLVSLAETAGATDIPIGN
ncbi:hypothetical protein [Sinimarinibacterium flocculans]|uniref:hypothetical protein n=1 Tax=Sinimarinibacterium flocculans TaxID=985250 RepID=UPI0024937CD8|nr:hypothetical protein [Sinimarinibacterium flocculans]